MYSSNLAVVKHVEIEVVCEHRFSDILANGCFHTYYRINR